MATRMILISWLVLAVAAAGARPTRIGFVRHGETVANKTGVYNSKNLNVFSDGGEQQVERLTQRLKAMPKFDAICVSPIPRALNTLVPYLRDTGRKAEVWPSLAECC